MIEIRFDKESELLWLKEVIGSGACNCGYPYLLQAMGVDLHQEVTYKPTDNYVDDVENNRKLLVERFKGMKIGEVNSILREEYLSKEAEEEGLCDND